MQTLFTEDESVKISLENGIIHYNYKIDVVDLPTQIKNLNDRLAFSGEVPRPIFVDATHVKYWTKEAREYTMRLDHAKFIKALAFYYTSYTHQVLLNWVQISIAPGIPMKIFPSKEQALEWLEQYI